MRKLLVLISLFRTVLYRNQIQRVWSINVRVYLRLLPPRESNGMSLELFFIMNPVPRKQRGSSAIAQTSVGHSLRFVASSCSLRIGMRNQHYIGQECSYFGSVRQMQPMSLSHSSVPSVHVSPYLEKAKTDRPMESSFNFSRASPSCISNGPRLFRLRFLLFFLWGTANFTTLRPNRLKTLQRPVNKRSPFGFYDAHAWSRCWSYIQAAQDSLAQLHDCRSQLFRKVPFPFQFPGYRYLLCWLQDATHMSYTLRNYSVESCNSVQVVQTKLALCW